MLKKCISHLLFIFVFIQLKANEPLCNIHNNVVQPGEKITFEISYNWLIPWIDVGVASFEVKEATIGKNTFYHIIGTGRSYKSWDWFYEVRDIYQSWVDPVTLKPYYFKRDVNEDGFKIDIEYEFNRKDTLVYSQHRDSKKPLTYDTLKVTACTYDIISILYYARNIDYSKYSPGDKIPITIMLDGKLTPIYFRYLENDKIRMKDLGRVKCKVFAAYTVEGTVFHEGENLKLWVTDDKNRIPIQIKTPILVGSIKAKLINYTGLKYKIGE